ncbi:MAG: hypothetical protein WBN03_16440 [Desulfobacterales bacterium]
MKFIYVSKKVETCIEALQKNGKAGTTLANKVKCVIGSLVSGVAQHHMDAIGSFTQNGEKRIRNCRKYDLGCGYRLITLQRGETVYIPFLGTHDNCQRWLESNNRLKDFNAGAGRMIRIVKKKPAKMIAKVSESTDNIADDPDVFKHLTDKDLRLVFSGLVRGIK